MSVLVTGLFFTIPLVVSGILHMVVVRTNVLASLKRPIAESLFGPNKTWRGVVVMPILTVIGVALAKLLEPAFGGMLVARLTPFPTVPLGVVLGLAYVLAELPNSYVKRRLGIPPGETPEKNRVLFVLVDQADSAVGCALAYLFMTSISLGLAALLAVLGPGVHLLVNVLLFLAGLRKRPV